MDVDNLESNSDKSLFSSPDDGSPALPSTPRDDVPTHLSFPAAAPPTPERPKRGYIFSEIIESYLNDLKESRSMNSLNNLHQRLLRIHEQLKDKATFPALLCRICKYVAILL